MPDLFQGKPGVFHLDECRACGHVFQNPRLSLDGLDFYYRDFYDGRAREHTETMFTLAGASYRGRAQMLVGVTRPKRWLDVGTGHGYFCLAARETWPETRFDGLDLTPNVVEAERRGWVERGFHGLFPDLADDLVGAYDVVSMHHYLEHTREPGLELDAAATVLEEGGHLLIEVPAPESRWPAGSAGCGVRGCSPSTSTSCRPPTWSRRWSERGFRVVARRARDGPPARRPRVRRHAPRQPPVAGGARRRGARRPPPSGGWRGPASTPRCLPLAGLAVAADQALVPVVRRRPQLSNAYRVLARKD